MKPEQWEQIERLYHSALEREPVERESFLDQACADDMVIGCFTRAGEPRATFGL